MPEHEDINIVQTTKMTKHPNIPGNMSAVSLSIKALASFHPSYHTFLPAISNHRIIPQFLILSKPEQSPAF